MIEKQEWQVKAHNGEYYNAIGYEVRGIFQVPIATIVDGFAISCDVFEIVNNFIGKNWNIGLTKPNSKEIELLEKHHWTYNGAFASYSK